MAESLERSSSRESGGESGGESRPESQEPESAPDPTPPPGNRARRVVARVIDVALWIAVAGVLFLAVYPKDSGPPVGERAVSQRLPAVGANAEGARTIPGALERPLLIEAFASWCGACRRNSGVLSDLKSAQDSGRLDVIAVSVDDHAGKALAAKESWPIPVEVFHDASGSFARDYRVDVLPTYVLVGVDGRVKRVTAGAPGASDIRAWLKEADNE